MLCNYGLMSYFTFFKLSTSVTTPLLEECEDDTHTPKMGTWESFRTLETSEFDCRGQNTSHLDVFISLERYRSIDVQNALTWTIWTSNTSYGKKKSQESNWRFDFQTLKVGNWFDLGVCRWSVTHRWKALKESYKFRPRPNWRSNKRVMISQSPKSLNRDSSGTPPWESWDKKPFGCKCHGEVQRILYGGRWWFPPSLGRGESCESMVAHGLS
jgi:hypothetical protein